MPKVKGLNHAVLFVSNVDRSAEFYTKALSMSIVASRPGAAVGSRSTRAGAGWPP